MAKYIAINKIDMQYSRAFNQVYPEYQNHMPKNDAYGWSVFSESGEFLFSCNPTMNGGYRKNPHTTERIVPIIVALANHHVGDRARSPVGRVCNKGNYATYRVWQGFGFGAVERGDKVYAVQPTQQSVAELERLSVRDRGDYLRYRDYVASVRSELIRELVPPSMPALMGSGREVVFVDV